jgi:hypothetical protein
MHMVLLRFTQWSRYDHRRAASNGSTPRPNYFSRMEAMPPAQWKGWPASPTKRESQNSLEIFGENFSASFRSR